MISDMKARLQADAETDGDSAKEPSPVGLIAIAAGIAIIGVGIGMAVAGKPSTDDFGPYAPELFPVWLAVVGLSALVGGIVALRPPALATLLPTLVRIALLLRAAAFIVWIVIAIGFVVG